MSPTVTRGRVAIDTAIPVRSRSRCVHCSGWSGDQGPRLDRLVRRVATASGDDTVTEVHEKTPPEPTVTQATRLDPDVWVGRVVHVVMDRPVGSVHPKHGAVYPINYGYVPGILAGDGEELDVYLLGTTVPVAECHAEVIAVVRRYDDVEDKLVARIGTGTWSRTEIATQIAFQECFYDSDVLVPGDRGRSCDGT